MLAPQPAASLPPIIPLLEPPPTTAQHRPRVLLIEDDPIQSRALSRLLETHGIAAHNVATTAAGLQAIATQPPYHAVISDLLLPDLPGDELARRLRGPLLLAYTGLDRFASWFDASLRKPELAGLLYLLQAPRIAVREALEVARTVGFSAEEWEEYDREKVAEQDAVTLAQKEGYFEGHDAGLKKGFCKASSICARCWASR